MTTAQCNRPRRCGCLQCVRDGERTNDHEKTPPPPNKRIKETTIFHMCVNPRNHHACRRWCAAHHHDKRRIAPTKQQKQKITNHKSQTKIKQAPFLISASQISTPQNQLQKPIFTTDAPLHTTNLQLRCSTFK